MSFVYDAGGAIAKEDGGQWKADLVPPRVDQGPNAVQDAVDKYMHGDQTKDESDRYIVYGQGKSGHDLRRRLGGRRPPPTRRTTRPAASSRTTSVNFVMPGPSGKDLPVFLGGSDLAVPVKSQGPGPRRRVDQRLHRHRRARQG